MTLDEDLRSQDVLEVKPPAFSAADAERIAADVFGVAGSARPLDSERDQNFHLRAGGGEEFVLKIANPAEDPALVDFQTRALLHIAGQDSALPVPRVVRTAEGEWSQIVEAPDGRRHVVRLVTHLPGTLLRDVPHTPLLLRDVGTTLARLGRALRGFFHPAAGHVLLWDPKQAARLREHVRLIEPAQRRRLVDDVLERFETQVLPVLPGLRAQVVHDDLHGDNTLVERERVTGIIDFGDMVHTPLVNDVAVTLGDVMRDKPDPIAAAQQVVAGYSEVERLSEQELALIPDLVNTRLAVGVTIAAWRASRHRELRADVEGYATQYGTMLEWLVALDREFVTGCLREACGLPACASSAHVENWLTRNASSLGPVLELDLRAACKRRLPAAAAAAARGEADERLRELLAGADVGLGAYAAECGCAGAGLGREAPTSPLHAEERRTTHLGIDLFVASGTQVHAPLAGHVHAVTSPGDDAGSGASTILEHRVAEDLRFYTLYGRLDPESLDGLEPGRPLAKGDALGRVAEPPGEDGALPCLHFQLASELLEVTPPAAVGPSKLAVWQSFSPDPNLVLRIPPEAFTEGEDDLAPLLARRAKVLGPALSGLSYARPLHLVRGEGAWLIDARGRAHLDAYNNVPHVGHCHPVVVEAIARQAATLSTNTRYLYDSLLEYAERLTATLPAELSVCMLLSSGSEANDVAWRLAKVHTRNDGAIVMEGAYHGITDIVDALSPSELRDLSALAPFVRTVAVPDVYRGPYRRDEPRVGERYAACFDEAIASLRAAGRAPALFMLDTILSSSGIMVAPEGWMAAAFEKVRAAGGLCVADEVQAGFGRTGDHLWGFEAHGVLPDIVTLGKPIGNGHPMAALVTTREIAQSMANRSDIFSTTGGNNVSCAAGLAVLDVLERERLQENAQRVGAYLRARLEALAKEHPLVGDVRGAGFFIGVELVRDRETLEPAAREAQAVVDGLRDEGVLVGRDGRHGNVLKIRPPMVFRESDADRLLGALDRVLGRL